MVIVAVVVIGVGIVGNSVVVGGEGKGKGIADEGNMVPSSFEGLDVT